MKYSVTFTQYFGYDVEADNEEDAIKEAEELFESDMRTPTARTDYDDVTIEYNPEEGAEDDE